MNIKKILIYVIFAFVMVIPFSVNAASYQDTNLNFKLRTSSVTLTNAQIKFLEEAIINMYEETDFSYFVAYNPDGNHYRVYVAYSVNRLYLTVSTCSSGNGLCFEIPYESYFNVNFNTSTITDFVNEDGYYSLINNAKGMFKDGEYNTMKYAKEEWGVLFSDRSTLNNLELEVPILYANSEFITSFRPTSFGSYSNFDNYSNWSSIFDDLRAYDYPTFSNSNIPNSVGMPINLTPPIETTTDYDDDVTVTYSYNGLDNNTLEIEVLIADKPFSCSNSITLGDNVCFNRKNYDYIDFTILVDGTINSKIYYSKDGTNFVKSLSNFNSIDGGYKFYLESFDTFNNGYKKVKFVINLTDEQKAVFSIKYNAKYLTVNMPVSTYDDSLYTEYDLTGKYAIGLIPKSNKLNSSVKFLGDFITYYSFDNDPYAYKYDTFSSLNYIVKSVDFTPFINQSNSIFYIINKNSSNLESVAKIKYLSNYFDIISFSSYADVVNFNDYNYVAPDTNVSVKNYYDNTLRDDSSSSSGVNFSDLFKSLPDFIVGLGSAFTALITCIFIVFDSLPEMVQSVLWFGVLISLIALARKFFTK